MLTSLLRFEWSYHTRQASFAAASAFFLLMGFTLSSTGFGPKNVAVNSPFLAMQSLGFLSLMSVFAAAIFVSNAVLRDSEHRLEAIIFSTPVDRFRYLASRSAGAFLAAATASGCSIAGMILGTFSPWLDAERVAAFNPGAHAWAFAVLMLPNVLFATVVLFAVAALTRNAVATYVGAVFVYVLYFAGAALTDSPLMAASTPGAESGPLASLLDPFGLASFFAATRYWNTAELNTRYVPLTGALLVNRAVWLGVTAAIWAAVHHRFSFRVMKRAKPKRIEAREAELRSRPASYAAVAPGRSATRLWFAAYVSSTRLETLAVAGSIPFLLLLALWMGLAGSEIYSAVSGSEYGTMSYPTTGLIVSTLQQPLAIIGAILTVYYGAEIFWRERRFQFASILDATPVPGSVVIAAKWSALALLIASIVASGIVTGIVVQVASGYWNIEPLVYLSLFYFAGVPLALYAAAALFIHALSPGKYAGMVLVLLFVVFAQFAGAFGVENRLWRFANAPSVSYTEMNGFGHDATSFGWFMLHWSGVAALLLLGAAGLWRFAGTGLLERARLSARRSNPKGRAIAATLVCCALATGGWIFYNTNVINARTAAAGLDDWKAEYETAYRPFSGEPRPKIAAVDVNLDLYPEQRRYHVTGRYELVNDSGAAIGFVLIAVRREAALENIQLDNARLARLDERFGMCRFEFDEPLAPGARAGLTFELDFVKRGFTGGGGGETVVANGSLLMSIQAFPTIGYRKSYEITDTRERQKRGLGPGSLKSLDEDDMHDVAEESEAEWTTFAATVSTSGEQTAIAPGRLERTWTEGNRRYFRYVSDAPMANRFAFASARYDVASRSHGNVDVEVYYHRGHEMNVERMLDAATMSLEVFEEQFGAYPHRQLRIAEVPPYWGFGAFAMPATILVAEDRAFLTDTRDPDRLDLVTRRIVHEVAHQWWGHELVPAGAEGATALVESLTKYAELIVMERLYGRAYVRRMLEIELDRYLSGRSREERVEQPLYRVGSQPYIYYGKGAIVTYAIRDLIGEAAMRDALGGLLKEHGGPGGHATTLDLLEHLRRVSPGREYALVEEWMKEITLYDLRIEPARVRQLADGRYEVTVRVTAAKSVAGGDGSESPRDFAEAIGFAVYSQHPDEMDGPDAILAAEKREIRPGTSEATFVVDGEPAYVAIDPDLSRIDRNRLDNVASLTPGS